MPLITRIIIAALLVLSPPLSAGDTVSLGVDEWPPYISQELQHNGPITKLVTDALAAGGLESKLKWLPWARALRGTEKARIDMTFPWANSEQRQQKFLLSEPLMTESTVIFHHKGLNFNWEKLSDLKGYRIGANTGHYYTEAFSEAEKSKLLDVTRVDDKQQLIQMLLLKRLDIILLARAPGHAFLKQAQASEHIVSHPKKFSERQLFALFPKADPKSSQRLAAFNKGLKEAKSRHAEILSQLH